jgi:hypothetical protein
LRCKDFDRDCTTLTISRGVTHRLAEDGSRCRIDTTETGEERTATIPRNVNSKWPRRDDVNWLHASPSGVEPQPTWLAERWNIDGLPVIAAMGSRLLTLTAPTQRSISFRARASRRVDCDWVTPTRNSFG